MHSLVVLLLLSLASSLDYPYDHQSDQSTWGQECTSASTS